MIWTAWRQQRAIAAAALAAFVVIAVVILVDGFHSQALWHQLLEPPCRGKINVDGSAERSCGNLMERISLASRYNDLIEGATIGFSVVLGAVLAANTVAREIQLHTVRLAWTQSRPRTKWLASKFAVNAALLILFLLPTCVLLWWWERAAPTGPRLMPFPYQAASFAVLWYGLFAFVLTVFLGLLIRRAGWTLAAAAVVLAVVLVLINGPIRTGLATVKSQVATTVGPTHITEATVSGLSETGAPSGAWVFRFGTAPRGLTTTPTNALFDSSLNALNACVNKHPRNQSAYNDCQRELGLTTYVIFVPDSEFWRVQLLESAIFVGLYALLIALSFERVRRIVV